jgi:accessory gene regulator B
MERYIRVIAFKTARVQTKLEKIIGDCWKEIKLIINQVKEYKSIIFTDDFKINYYIAQALYGDMSKVILTLLISLLLGMFYECLIIIISFGLLRILSGGFHAKTFNSCFIITVGTYLIASGLAKYLLHYNLDWLVYLITTIVLIGVLILYAPRFVTEESESKKKKYKIFSIIYTAICFLISLVANKIIAIPIFVGIILQTFLLTPVGYKLFNWLDHKISVRRINR